MSMRKISVLLPALLLVQVLSPAFLSVGAVSAEYIMLAPKRLYIGTESSVSISSFSSETGRPIDRRVVLTLTGSGTDLVLIEGRTGPDGHLIARFDVPDMAKGSYRLVLSSPDGGESVSGDVTVSDAITLLIETDKPIFGLRLIIENLRFHGRESVDRFRKDFSYTRDSNYRASLYEGRHRLGGTLEGLDSVHIDMGVRHVG